MTPSARGGGGASFRRVPTGGGGTATGVELLAAVGTPAVGFGFVAGRLLGSSTPCLDGESDSCNLRLMEGFGGGGGVDLRDAWVLLRE